MHVVIAAGGGDAASSETRYFPWIGAQQHSQTSIWWRAFWLWVAPLAITFGWLLLPLGPGVVSACNATNSENELLYVLLQRACRMMLGCILVLRVFLHAGVAIPNTRSQVRSSLAAWLVHATFKRNLE